VRPPAQWGSTCKGLVTELRFPILLCAAPAKRSAPAVSIQQCNVQVYMYAHIDLVLDIPGTCAYREVMIDIVRTFCAHASVCEYVPQVIVGDIASNFCITYMHIRAQVHGT
jgi:hypothetical protein